MALLTPCFQHRETEVGQLTSRIVQEKFVSVKQLNFGKLVTAAVENWYNRSYTDLGNTAVFTLT